MKKYYIRVSYLDRVENTFVVKAENEEQAEEKAYQICGGPDGFEVEHIEEN